MVMTMMLMMIVVVALLESREESAASHICTSACEGCWGVGGSESTCCWSHMVWSEQPNRLQEPSSPKRLLRRAGLPRKWQREGRREKNQNPSSSKFPKSLDLLVSLIHEWKAVWFEFLCSDWERLFTVKRNASIAMASMHGGKCFPGGAKKIKNKKNKINSELKECLRVASRTSLGGVPFCFCTKFSTFVESDFDGWTHFCCR